MAAELNKRGAIATLYLTSTPRVDVVATDPDQHRSVNVQVKTSTSGRWHGNIDRLRSERDSAASSDFIIFVHLGSEEHSPTYYVCPMREFAAQHCQGHEDWIKRHGGTRPKSPESKHTLVTADGIEQWRERWDLLGILD